MPFETGADAASPAAMRRELLEVRYSGVR